MRGWCQTPLQKSGILHPHWPWLWTRRRWRLFDPHQAWAGFPELCLSASLPARWVPQYSCYTQSERKIDRHTYIHTFICIYILNMLIDTYIYTHMYIHLYVYILFFFFWPWQLCAHLTSIRAALRPFSPIPAGLLQEFCRGKGTAGAQRLSSHQTAFSCSKEIVFRVLH